MNLGYKVRRDYATALPLLAHYVLNHSWINFTNFVSRHLGIPGHSSGGFRSREALFELPFEVSKVMVVRLIVCLVVCISICPRAHSTSLGMRIVYGVLPSVVRGACVSILSTSFLNIDL